MTVGELKAKLAGMDDALPVVDTMADDLADVAVSEYDDDDGVHPCVTLQFDGD